MKVRLVRLVPTLKVVEEPKKYVLVPVKVKKIKKPKVRFVKLVKAIVIY